MIGNFLSSKKVYEIGYKYKLTNGSLFSNQIDLSALQIMAILRILRTHFHGNIFFIIDSKLHF